jgi:hypothetical protein
MATAVLQLGEERQLTPQILESGSDLLSTAENVILREMDRHQWTPILEQNKATRDLVTAMAQEQAARHAEQGLPKNLIPLFVVGSDTPYEENDDPSAESLVDNLMRWTCYKLIMNHRLAAVIEHRREPNKKNQYETVLVVHC